MLQQRTASHARHGGLQRSPVRVVRPHDQVELGHAPQQRGALLRRHAPGHDQLQAAHVLPLALRLRSTMQGWGWERLWMRVRVLSRPASAAPHADASSTAQRP